LDCEIACDNSALSFLSSEERIEYGYTIVRLLKLLTKPQLIPGTTGMLRGKGQIKKRIMKITFYGKQPLHWALIAIIVFVVIGFTGLTDANHKNDMKVLQLSENNLNTLQKTVEEYNNKYNKMQSQYHSLKEQMKSNQIYAGTIDVKGEGIVVTLSEDKTGANSANSAPTILDIDVRQVVNELASAGAEAISVNHERIISTSKIMTVKGESLININGNKYRSPFIIESIGNPEALESILKDDNIINALKLFGFQVKIEKANKLIIPKYSGNKQLKYAQPIDD